MLILGSFILDLQQKSHCLQPNNNVRGEGVKTNTKGPSSIDRNLALIQARESEQGAFPVGNIFQLFLASFLSVMPYNDLFMKL